MKDNVGKILEGLHKEETIIEASSDFASKGKIIKVLKDVFKPPFVPGTVWVCDEIKKTETPGEGEIKYTQLDKDGERTKVVGSLYSSLVSAGLKLKALSLEN
jgi:hypothetical protein